MGRWPAPTWARSDAGAVGPARDESGLPESVRVGSGRLGRPARQPARVPLPADQAFSPPSRAPSRTMPQRL